MPGIEVEIRPPSLWQDFERVTLDYAKKTWGDAGAERHGRQGQAQAGVDVYGHNLASGEHTGIQCKKRARSSAPSKRLTVDDIDKEITSAQSFIPPLDRFIIATTGPRDGDLQEHVRLANKSGLPFKVSLLFWDDFQEFFNNHVDMLDRYYREILEYRATSGQDVNYLQLLRQAFDRPAIRTPFHCENEVSDFIQAISDTCNAITTGRLVDRSKRIIDETRVPKPKPEGVKRASRSLQKARDLATSATRDKLLVQKERWVEIHSDEVSEQLNKLRQQAIDALNTELKKFNLEELDFFFSRS